MKMERVTPCYPLATVAAATRGWPVLVQAPPQVVYEWARGTPFQDICQLTDVMEGSIVRAIVRLEETCRCVFSRFFIGQ